MNLARRLVRQNLADERDVAVSMMGDQKHHRHTARGDKQKLFREF